MHCLSYGAAECNLSKYIDILPIWTEILLLPWFTDDANWPHILGPEVAFGFLCFARGSVEES